MDDLDVELIGLIVRWSAAFMRPLLYMVSRKWLRAVSDVRQIDQHQRLIVYDTWGRLLPPPPRIHMSFEERERYGYCPIHDGPLERCRHSYVLCLIDRGQSKLLAWAHDFGISTLPCDAPERAALTGNVPLLGWLAEKGCQIDSRVSLKAARHGHRCVLDWLRGMGFKRSKRAVAKALRGGHGQLFEWLYEHRNGRDVYPYREAALAGRIDLLERFGRDCKDHGEMCHMAYNGAAASGDARTIEWLWDSYYEIAQFACYEAATHGHLAVLQQLLVLFGGDVEEDARRDICEGVALKGQLHMMEWLCEKGWASQVDCIFCAVNCIREEDGIAWLQKHGIVPAKDVDDTKEAIKEAARRGNVRMLAFLHGLGCAMTESALRAALCERQWPAVQWLLEHADDDIFMPRITLYEAVFDNSQLAMVEWLRRQRRWPAPECVQLFAHVARHGHVGTLQWLKDRGCPWDASVPVSVSMLNASRGLTTVQWLHEHGCPLDARVSINAAGSGNLPVLKWVLSSGVPWHRARCRKLCEELHHRALLDLIDAQPHGPIESDVRYDAFRPSICVFGRDAPLP